MVSLFPDIDIYIQLQKKLLCLKSQGCKPDVKFLKMFYGVVVFKRLSLTSIFSSTSSEVS